MNWTDTVHCQSQIHCKACCASTERRLRLTAGYDTPAICPYGKVWIGESKMAEPTPESEIYDAANRGLGDEVQRLAKILGFKRLSEIWTNLTGKDCGCENRRKWMNRRWPGGWRQILKEGRFR